MWKWKQNVVTPSQNNRCSEVSLHTEYEGDLDLEDNSAVIQKFLDLDVERVAGRNMSGSLKDRLGCCNKSYETWPEDTMFSLRIACLLQPANKKHNL